MKKKRVSALLAGSLAVLLIAGMTGCGSNTASVTENDTKTATRAGTTVQTEVAEQSTGKTKITAEEAKAIILADLGVSKADFIELDSERDDNEYEFEVVVGEYEYDYDVNFFTGKIVDKDVDKMDAEDKAEVEAKKAAAETPKTATETPATEPSKDTTVSKPVVTPSNGTNNKEEVKVPSEKISKEKAKEIALADLGISNAKLVESDYDDGKYEFEFKADGVEYSYEIHAKTGKIVDKDVDRDDWDDDRDDDEDDRKDDEDDRDDDWDDDRYDD